MFYDLFLKAADEAQLKAALVDAGVAVVGEDGSIYAVDSALDVIGVIYEPLPPGSDPENPPPPVPLPGYHANLRLSQEPTFGQVAALADILITPPHTPARIWAGGMFPWTAGV